MTTLVILILTALILIQQVFLALLAYRTEQQLDRLLTRAADERAELLQRIQAPEQAVISHVQDHMRLPDPLPLPYDDDAAYHESREELAARLNNFEQNPTG